MQTQAEKNEQGKSKAVANTVSEKKRDSASTFQLVDNRPEAVTQQKLQGMADTYSAEQEHPLQKKENHTGLPDDLKAGVENLSGHSMDDVKVHYNSDKPAQLNAHAYAQGTDIHLASGQEKHLPHEAWHVVQQKQGRVKPTLQMKGGVNVNDDKGLEKEADVMGGKAHNFANNGVDPVSQMKAIIGSSSNTVQRVGELDALKKITGKDSSDSRGKEMRRGNVRASIIDTSGKSQIWVSIIRSDEFNKKLSGALERLYNRLYPDKADFITWYKLNYSLIYGLIINYIGYGNCGEFAAALKARLLQDTQDQYIYSAKYENHIPINDWTEEEKKLADSNGGPLDFFITDGDHAFVVTYPHLVSFNIQSFYHRNSKKIGKEKRYAVNEMDMEKVRIADGWLDRKVSKRDNLNGIALYRVDKAGENKLSDSETEQVFKVSKYLSVIFNKSVEEKSKKLIESKRVQDSYDSFESNKGQLPKDDTDQFLDL